MRNTSPSTIGPEEAGSPSSSGSAATTTMTSALTPDTPVEDVSTYTESIWSVEGARVKRKIKFQYLVRRYISQTLYGCVERHCTTAMCRSSQLRVKNAPYRAPTELTARTLAYYLAAQDDPTACLCPHSLNVAPSDIGYPEFPRGPLSGTARSHTPVRIINSEEEHSRDVNDVQEEEPFWTLLQNQHLRNTQIDNFSLSQNLFNTASSIYFYFKNIPDKGLLDTKASISQPNLPSNALVQETPSSWTAHGGFALTLEQGSATPHSFSRRTTPEVDCDASCEVKLDGRRHSINSGHASEILIPESKHRAYPTSKKSPFEVTQEVELLEFDGSTKIKPKPGNPKRPSITKKRQDTLTYRLPAKALRVTQVAMVEPWRVLTCEVMETLKVILAPSTQSAESICLAYSRQDYRRLPRRPKAATRVIAERFLRQTLSSADRLVQSFVDHDHDNHSPLPHLNADKLESAFTGWSHINGAFVFDCLWEVLAALFRPPPEIIVDAKGPRLRTNGISLQNGGGRGMTPPDTDRIDDEGRYLSDLQAAHIVVICIHALTSHVPKGASSIWSLFRLRSQGGQLPWIKGLRKPFAKALLGLVDAMQYEPALRLAGRLIRAISARRCFWEITQALQGGAGLDIAPSTFGLTHLVLDHLRVVERGRGVATIDLTEWAADRHDSWTITSVWVEWLKTMCINHWNKEPLLYRWDVVGGAISLMGEIANFRPRIPDMTDRLLFNEESFHQFGLGPRIFRIPYLYAHLDKTTVSGHFMERDHNPNYKHILEYPFLFTPKELLGFFRTLNYGKMFSAYETGERSRFLSHTIDILQQANASHPTIRRIFSRYLVLDVRRDHALEDSINQLWHLDKSQLLKPLKVRIGALEGEDGIDLGGVSLEFFRIALAEAFNMDNGMFTIDPQTRMTWFRPASPASLQNFEVVGILFALAVHNGITLPVNFPLAFYYRVLELEPEGVQLLEDGWPDVSKSFRQLLLWNDGDVSETFGVSHEFTIDALGLTVNVNMSDHAAGLFNVDTGHLRILDDVFGTPATYEAELSTEPAPVVTNATRECFVSDYIYWLTYKSVAPQILAFKRGFSTILNKNDLSFFDAPRLRKLVEGQQEIDMAGLMKHATYEEGYEKDSPIIVGFWALVSEYTPERRAKLLEFVTASDRIPVGGVENMMFAIVRNGGDSEMLPTSSTCYGKLLLPEYESIEKMKEKLELALNYSKGFGVL